MSQRRYVINQQLIAANVELISAMSWYGYQREGRGAVLITRETADDLEVARGPLAYMSDQRAQEIGDSWPSKDVAGMVKEYSPDSEVIVMLRGPASLDVYRFKPATPPPAAYESLKEALEPGKS